MTEKLNSNELAYYIVDGVLDKLHNAYDVDFAKNRLNVYTFGVTDKLTNDDDSREIVDFIIDYVYTDSGIDVVEDDALMLVDYIQEILDHQDEL